MINHKCGCQVTDAVIFDMDGVIVDSEMLYLNLRWQFAREKNPEVTLEELYPTVGRSSEGSWSLVAEAVHNGMTWQELLAEYRKTVVCTYASIDFASVFRREIPGVLESLKQRGIRLALASSNGLSIVEKSLRITAYALISRWWSAERASGAVSRIRKFICTRLPAWEWSRNAVWWRRIPPQALRRPTWPG